ncbi:MAG: HU family DNA-binding protein [Bryobacterales bacterium]|nr:HU family DNA-binding protein [Bryobacterales bacterium]
MKQSALVRRLARATGVTPAAAADQLDSIVAQIVGRLRRGQSAKIPGLGAFPPGNRSQFDFAKPLKPGKVPQ